MIDVKQAVQIARDYMHTVYSDEEIPNLLLEEVKRTDDDQYWLITFGFDTKQKPDYSPTLDVVGLANPVRPQFIRAYRTIKVRADTGESVEMSTVREL
jgi:hypothetical protein